MPGRTIKAEAHGQDPDVPFDAGTAASLPGDPSQDQSRRVARSGAPSVSTRMGRQTIAGSYGGEGGDDGDDPILMEVRQVKSQPAESVLGRIDAPLAHQNVSFVSHGFTAIGDKVKELNDTLGELQSLGIQHVASLPELVLVGDQSAGKSSLMSGFSDIFLPRSEGACTRCPVHIRLSGSHGNGPWMCRVSLQQDYEYRPPQAVTRANPFGPWFEKRRDIKDFANLTDPSKIEETLKWAQIATLNPHTEHSLYKPGTGEIWRRYRTVDNEDGNSIRNQAAFSPNMVALDISAPGLADLSFYDLPGVFTSAKQDEEQYLVKVVRNLTAKYIAHQQAIILWAVPMNVDPETSATFSIIREEKAQLRTIGVMTKADLLPPSAGAQWMAMLRGEQHKVGHGYFMTARPIVTEGLLPDEMVQSSARDPSRPADELERQGAFEEAFFNNQQPGLSNQEWPDCFREFEDRCGVNRLVAFMSQQLGHEFAKCLPEIKEKVTSKLLDVNLELSQLPDMPDNPELEIRRSLGEFATHVRTLSDSSQLTSSLNVIVDQFQKQIEGLKPKYKVKAQSFPSAQASSRQAAVDTNGHVDLTMDDDAISVTGTSPAPGITPAPPSGALQASMSHRRQHTSFLDGHQDTSGPSTPSKRPRGLDSNGGSVKQEDLSEGIGSPALGAISRRVLFRAIQPRPSRTLQAVRDFINARSKPGMANIVSEDVYNSLCIEAAQPWSTPLLQLLDRVYQLLDTKLHELLSSALNTLQSRLIYRRSSSILKRFLVDRLSEVRTTLLQTYQLETRKFYTMNNASLQRYEKDERHMLQRFRHHHRMVAYLGERGKDRQPPKDWDLMSDEERAREKTMMNQELVKLGPDDYARELNVCATVRGYYRTASTRFIDTCTMHIASGLLPDVISQLSRFYLDTQLGVFDKATPQMFSDLMDEDEETAAKRRSLKEDRNRFQQTMESIQRLENSSQNSQEQVHAQNDDV